MEYRPCVVSGSCWDLIKEFLQGFLGSNVSNNIPSYFTTPSIIHPNQTKVNDIYQPIDTVLQYLDHFTNYRKMTTSVVRNN